MARTTNEILVDQAIRQATLISRFETTVVKEIVGKLNREIIPDLLQKIKKSNVTPKSKKRLQNLLVSLKATALRGSKTLEKDLTKILQDFSVFEADWQVRGLDRAMPFDFSFNSPSVETLRSSVINEPIQGRTVRKWFDKQARSTIKTINTNVRIGLAEGETLGQIVKRFTGKNSLLNTNRRQVEAIVRTSLNHTGTQARNLVFAENKDVIKGEQWVSTLDSRTTDICAGLDGREFKVGMGVMPPAHFQCRSIRVPIIKSFEELGIPGLKKLPPAQRASLDGLVPARQTYPQWLRKQPVKTQNEVLGVGRAKLFRGNKVTIDKFTTNQQRSLSLKEIRKREGIPEPKKLRKKVIKSEDTVSKGFNYKSEQLDFISKLSQEQRNVMSNYVSFESGRINKQIRNAGGVLSKVKSSEIQRKVISLDNTIKNSKPFANSQTTYRGIRLSNDKLSQIKVGGTYSELNFMSTSSSKDVASRFINPGLLGRNEIPTLLRIQNQAGTRMAFGSGRELELILGRNSKFSIKEIKNIRLTGPDGLYDAKEIILEGFVNV